MTTQNKIDKLEKELIKLKEKLKQERDKTEWLYIPELKIEVQTKIHSLNQTLEYSMKKLKKDESVISYEQIQWLRNSKYCEQLNLMHAWEFVYPNPDKISENNGLIARFVASSDRAFLSCDWSPTDVNSSLGVRFVRPLNKLKEKKNVKTM